MESMRACGDIMTMLVVDDALTIRHTTVALCPPAVVITNVTVADVQLVLALHLIMVGITDFHLPMVLAWMSC